MRLLDSFFQYVIVVLGGTLGVSHPTYVSPIPSVARDPPANSTSTAVEASTETPDPDLQLPNPYGPTNPYLIDPETQAAPPANGAGADGASQTAYPQGAFPNAYPQAYGADPYAANHYGANPGIINAYATNPAADPGSKSSSADWISSLPSPYGPVNPYEVEVSSPNAYYGSYGAGSPAKTFGPSAEAQQPYAASGEYVHQPYDANGYGQQPYVPSGYVQQPYGPSSGRAPSAISSDLQSQLNPFGKPN